jgi:hypothetical protein
MHELVTAALKLRFVAVGQTGRWARPVMVRFYVFLQLFSLPKVCTDIMVCVTREPLMGALEIPKELYALDPQVRRRNRPRNPCNDAYLYGTPHLVPRTARSQTTATVLRCPMEFVPHAIWLMRGSTGQCDCIPSQNQNYGRGPKLGTNEMIT